MTERTSLYKQDYNEIKWIGRGNFGSVYLIQNKETDIKFVAKKVLLGQLPDKEQQNALLEVNLLRYLNHPNIVGYIGSYVEDGLLIIVMEYWDVGDLSYHIKKKKKEGGKFEENEILNWFIQISMALEYIHSKKILHRDIKASNIFLTGNNTVKLGDFGISRLLENTCDAANTVVGTPYYMSPEVWENKPYTYKSDIWALGWVLYELCALEHAFSAENLLSLVYKIVQEKHSPIPSYYSEDINMLVEMLLVKDCSMRPLISNVFMIPLVREKMEEFIQNGGFIGNHSLHARKFKTKKFGKTAINSSEIQEEMKKQVKSKSFSQDNHSTMTPKEKIAMKKRKKADEKANKLKEYITKTHHKEVMHKGGLFYFWKVSELMLNSSGKDKACIYCTSI
jgi:NIMA (never in mitosis gene a)-related kinase 1/4/5